MIFLAKRGRRSVFVGIATITTLSLALSIYQTQSSPILAFYSLPTRAWELGIGALLLFVPVDLFKQRLLPWLGLSGLLVAAFNYNDNTAFPGVNALLPVIATALLMVTISIWPPIFNDLSNNRFSQWLGKISYPLYLWHWPALVIPSSALGRPLHVLERFICIAVTILLAHLTNKFIEEPLRHVRIAPRKLYLTALSTSLVSLTAGILIATTASSVISTKGEQSFSFDLKEVMAKPAVYGNNCHVNYGETKSGYCTFGDKTSTTTIVLYGDSHAAQWFPTLEQLAIDKGFKLISLTKSACPAVDAPRPDQGAFKNVHCEKWRENSVARIQEIHPAAVITSNFQYFTPPAGYNDRKKWWSDGQKRLLDSLKGSSDHLIYLSDTPRPLRDIPSCLASKDSTRCDSTEKSSVSVIKGFQVIDPTPWLCTSSCPAIIDSIVAYRDASHISVAMARHLLPELKEALIKNGLFA